MTRSWPALALAALMGVPPAASIVAAQQPGTAASSSAAGAAAASSNPEPSARIVRFDAIVTDRQGRPLSDLGAGDFEIVENGVAQRIDAVERRSGEPAGDGPDATPIETPEDEARAARQPGTRVVALLLDEFHVSAGPASDRVRSAAVEFVEERLRPSDLLVVLKPLDPLTGIRFTRDRDAVRRAIASFAGRRGDFTALSEFEEKYIGRAPAAVQAARAQIVFSGLRALTMKLGELGAGRSAIVLVSEGFGREPRERSRRVPDVQGLVRAASRHNVSIYTFDPGDAGLGEAGTSANAEGSLRSLATPTGGEAVGAGGDLDAAFQRVARDLSSYYLLSYTSSHTSDGRFYEVQVRAKPPHALVRTRSGYWAPLRAELLRGSDSRPAAPARVLKRSPLIETWLGLTVEPDGTQRVILTWEPAAARSRARPAPSVPSVVAVRATTPSGAVLFEREIRTPRAVLGVVRDEAAMFEASPGRLQIDLAILSADGSRLDSAAHDIDVPDVSTADPLILPPQVFRTASHREFRAISDNPVAAPVPARAFRRTDRLLLRVPTHSASGARVELTARVLNRVGQTLREIPPMRGRAAGAAEFDLPLAWLAPGEYTIELNAETPAGSAKEIVRIRVTG